MGTIGVILALAVSPLQWEMALEENDPGPPLLWGDDVRVWNMFGDSSTYLCDGLEYCDMTSYSDTLYAVAIRESLDYNVLTIFRSVDTSYTWKIASFVSLLRDAYSPNMRMTDDGSVLYASTSVRRTSDDFFYVFRYDMPDFDNYQASQIHLPAAADTVCTPEIVEQISSGNFWLLGGDVSGNMYLSLSEDTCKTWSPFEPVLTDVTRHAAMSDNAGTIYMTFRDLETNEAKLAVFEDPETVEVYTIGDAASDASPKLAVFREVVTTIGVTYHNEDEEVIIARSADQGSSWNLQNYARGRYPNIDIDRLSGECGICYLDSLGTSVSVATAPKLAQIYTTEPLNVSDRIPYANGPAIIRHDFVKEEYGLLYMSTTLSGIPQDLWFDSSLYPGTGVEDGSFTGSVPLRVCPNPATGAFTASFQLPEPQQATLSVYSTDGRLVGSFYSGVTDGEEVSVDTDLPAGVYSVVLRSESGVSSARMVSL